MDKAYFLSDYHINKISFTKSHTAGEILSFSSPCIGYILKGSGEFFYRGKTFYAYEGDLIYIAAETKYYSVWSGTPDIEFYSLGFSFANPYSFIEYRFQILHKYPQKIIDDIYGYKKSSPFKSAACLYMLFSDIYLKMTKDRNFSKHINVSPAIEYIEENYEKKITVEFLADLCKISQPYFYARFREITGVTPIGYKHNIIIQHALDYLSNTDLSVEEISDRLGFSSPNYFRKIFIKMTGKTPKEIRQG